MKIIVVEDEPKSREGILNILARDTEYEVAAVCGNGKEGLEAACVTRCPGIMRRQKQSMILREL